MLISVCECAHHLSIVIMAVPSSVSLKLVIYRNTFYCTFTKLHDTAQHTQMWHDWQNLMLKIVGIIM